MPTGFDGMFECGNQYVNVMWSQNRLATGYWRFLTAFTAYGPQGANVQEKKKRNVQIPEKNRV